MGATTITELAGIVSRARMEVYRLVEGQYQILAANERDRYPISPLGVELGIWQGWYQNAELPWLRWLVEFAGQFIVNR